MAVGADFGPDNLLYLLERSDSPLGFWTRVRRFDLAQDDLAEEILLKRANCPMIILRASAVGWTRRVQHG